MTAVTDKLACLVCKKCDTDYVAVVSAFDSVIFSTEAKNKNSIINRISRYLSINKLHCSCCSFNVPALRPMDISTGHTGTAIKKGLNVKNVKPFYVLASPTGFEPVLPA
jgi:hypothetical protein